MGESFEQKSFYHIFFFLFKKMIRDKLFKFIFISSPTLDVVIIKFSFPGWFYVNYYFFIPKQPISLRIKLSKVEVFFVL